MDADSVPKAHPTVLVIDADVERGRAVATILEFLNYRPILFDSFDRATAAAPEVDDLLVALVALGEDRAVARKAIKTLHQAQPHVTVYTLCEQDAPRDLSRELNGGVAGNVECPIRYPQLSSALRQAEEHNASFDREGRNRTSMELFRSLVGNSRGSRRVRHLVEKVAPTEANVLILGESGTGKEVVARNIHYFSKRRGQPFVPINCGAIPGELLESELFGHEKGSFTGAINARQGRFEMAEGGTLFLDEIGDMPPAMQVKLLRVLQERVFERVGSNKSLTADVRIIAATHRNLEEHIGDGRFREDLYYRLNVFPVDMPPLRERVEDIPLLVHEIIARLEAEGRGSVRFAPDAVAALGHYRWPGNIRELANLIERLAILYPFGVVQARDLPEKITGTAPVDDFAALVAEPSEQVIPFVADMVQLPEDGIDLKEHLGSVEASLIRQALDDADGVVAQAAKRLHLQRTTLAEKLRKYGLRTGQ